MTPTTRRPVAPASGGRAATAPGPPGGGRAALLAAARAELIDHGHAAISLRAVARRAGVSHAAPKSHFGDRAGLLTAVATEGFDALTAALHAAAGGPGADGAHASALAGLGRAYLDFGLTHPALFDLMFRPTELNPDDPDLHRARAAAITVLATVTADPSQPTVDGDGDGDGDGVPVTALVSWAFIHGLLTLTRDGALTDDTTAGSVDAADLAHHLTDVFARQWPVPRDRLDPDDDSAADA